MSSILGKRKIEKQLPILSKRQKNNHVDQSNDQHLLSNLKQFKTLLNSVDIFDFIASPMEIFEFISAVKNGNFL